MEKDNTMINVSKGTRNKLKVLVARKRLKSYDELISNLIAENEQKV